jgi:hypothetical protein
LNLQWVSCTPSIACTTPNMTYRIYTESKKTLINLVTNTNLECEGISSTNGISLLGTCFFLGLVFSFILWIKVVKRGWARKPIILLGAAFQNIGFIAILFFPISLKVLQFSYFLMGLGSVLTNCTSYNFLNEFTPNHSKIIVSTLYLSFQILPAILLPVYLALIDEDVFPFLWLGLGLSLLGSFLTLSSIPESPHFLYSTGSSFLECQASLNYIARFNGVS